MRLGSTSLTMDASGTKIGEMKYYPFGETRYTWGGTPTDRRFTGQREENGLGSLYDYNARFYSPVLGRFISADTIVPDGKNPQAFNRYSYVNNNPMRCTDPSGHCPFCLFFVVVGVFAIADWGAQVIENHNEGLTGGNEFYYKNLDLERSAGAAVNGAVTYATGAAFSAAGLTTSIAEKVGSTLAARAAAGALEGAVSNVAGTMAGNLTTGSLKGEPIEKIDVLHNVDRAAAWGAIAGTVSELGQVMAKSQANAAWRASNAAARENWHQILRYQAEARRMAFLGQKAWIMRYSPKFTFDETNYRLMENMFKAFGLLPIDPFPPSPEPVTGHK